jgi:hypothetical protein
MKILHTLSHIRLTLTMLPWKRKRLARQTTVSDCMPKNNDRYGWFREKYLAFGPLVRVPLTSLMYQLFSFFLFTDTVSINYEILIKIVIADFQKIAKPCFGGPSPGSQCLKLGCSISQGTNLELTNFYMSRT